MYLITTHNIFTGIKTVRSETDDPARAYELAHEIDSDVHLGRDESYISLEDPCVVRIENEDGTNMWRECCEARCPVALTGLFQ